MSTPGWLIMNATAVLLTLTSEFAFDVGPSSSMMARIAGDWITCLCHEQNRPEEPPQFTMNMMSDLKRVNFISVILVIIAPRF